MFRGEPCFERVLTTLKLVEPDRVPLGEIWIDPEVKDAFMGFPVRNLKDDVEFWRRAGYDFIALDVDLYATPQIQRGISRTAPNTATLYAGHRVERSWATSHVGAISTQSDCESFPWPTANDVDLSHLAEACRHLPTGMKALVTSGHVFTATWQLMGFEAFCVALYEDSGLVDEILLRLGDETLALLERILAYDSVGVLCFQDDIAYTNGLMISPDMLRRIFFPWLHKFVSLCHDAGRPVLFHSDGNLNKAMQDIVDSEVDGIQAIEPKCMDIAAVKRDFGQNLALMGNLDLGYTLTRGTPQEVKDEVRSIIHHAGSGGGLLVGSANSITNYVPLENYQALLDAVFEFGAYPITVDPPKE
jgi:uroporphyrinogen decarboxylase